MDFQESGVLPKMQEPFNRNQIEKSSINEESFMKEIDDLLFWCYKYIQFKRENLNFVKYLF